MTHPPSSPSDWTRLMAQHCTPIAATQPLQEPCREHLYLPCCDADALTWVHFAIANETITDKDVKAMKSSKSYLDEFRYEQKNDRTDRIARTLVEEAAAERQERSRSLRKARLERDASARTNAMQPLRRGKGDQD